MKNQYLNLNIIGSDETGVGDYLSPLVASAVFVPKKNVLKLENLGITDSKKLTDKKIIELAETIKPLIVFQVQHLTQSGYNKLNKTFNANELKMFLHLSAINGIEERVSDADLIIIDKFSTDESINKYYERLLASTFEFKAIKTPRKLVEKGEMEHVAVAAASIIARSYFIKYMEEQNQRWNTKFPLGTNQIVEEFVKKFVAQYGIKELEKIAKIKFKTTKKLFGEI